MDDVGMVVAFYMSLIYRNIGFIIIRSFIENTLETKFSVTINLFSIRLIRHLTSTP